MKGFSLDFMFFPVLVKVSLSFQEHHSADMYGRISARPYPAFNLLFGRRKWAGRPGAVLIGFGFVYARRKVFTVGLRLPRTPLPFPVPSDKLKPSFSLIEKASEWNEGAAHSPVSPSATCEAGTDAEQTVLGMPVA